MENKDGVWRTIRGRRIFIGKGEDLATAMKNSGKFSNQMSRVKKNKEKYDIIQKAKNFDKDLKKTNRERYDIDKSHEKDKWEEQEKYKARHNTKEAQRYEKNEYKKHNQALENYKNKYAEYRQESDKYGNLAETDKTRQLGQELRNIEKENNLKGKDTIKIMQDYDLEKEKIADYKAKKQSNNKIDNNEKMIQDYKKIYGDVEIYDNKLNETQTLDTMAKDYEKYGGSVDFNEFVNHRIKVSKENDDRYKVKHKIGKQSNNKINDREFKASMGEVDIPEDFEAQFNDYARQRDKEEKKWEVKSTGGFGQEYGEGNIPIRDGKVDYESHFGALAQDLTLLSDKELKTALETQQKMYDKYSSRPKSYDARTRNGRMQKIVEDSELTDARLSVEALKKEVVRRENEKHPQYKGTEYEVKYASVKDAINDPNSKINQYIAKKKSNHKVATEIKDGKAIRNENAPITKYNDYNKNEEKYRENLSREIAKELNASLKNASENRLEKEAGSIRSYVDGEVLSKGEKPYTNIYGGLERSTKSLENWLKRLRKGK